MPMRLRVRKRHAECRIMRVKCACVRDGDARRAAMMLPVARKVLPCGLSFSGF